MKKLILILINLVVWPVLFLWIFDFDVKIAAYTVVFLILALLSVNFVLKLNRAKR